MMEGENVLEAILDEGSVDDFDDIEMLDVEEGELVEQHSIVELGQSSGADADKVNQETGNKNQRQRKKKRKNKRKRWGTGGAKVTDVNRFVLDVCKRLREKKSYLVYTAVACLGVSALSDLVKEVDAIQQCGGQKTADGKRFRTGGGILWNILKTRDPNAYKEIMKKGKDFEKQFKQPVNKQIAVSSSAAQDSLVSPHVDNEREGLHIAEETTNPSRSNAVEKRASVHDRLRVLVTYDDIVEGEVQNND